MTEPCKHCAVDTGLYDFANDCCCARFLSHAPDKAIRAAWLNRWLTQFGAERTDHIKQLVSEAWDKHKRAAQ